MIVINCLKVSSIIFSFDRLLNKIVKVMIMLYEIKVFRSWSGMVIVVIKKLEIVKLRMM